MSRDKRKIQSDAFGYFVEPELSGETGDRDEEVDNGDCDRRHPGGSLGCSRCGSPRWKSPGTGGVPAREQRTGVQAGPATRAWFGLRGARAQRGRSERGPLFAYNDHYDADNERTAEYHDHNDSDIEQHHHHNASVNHYHSDDGDITHHHAHVDDRPASARYNDGSTYATTGAAYEAGFRQGYSQARRDAEAGFGDGLHGDG